MLSRNENDNIDLENPPQPIPTEEPDNDDDLEMSRDRNVLVNLARHPSGPVGPDEAYTLQRQIQESKIPLENELRRISRYKQSYYLLGGVIVGAILEVSSIALGGEWNPLFISGIILSGSAFLGIVAGTRDYILPLYKLPCIKYPRLNTLVEGYTIINTMRNAHAYFPSIPTVNGDEDAAAVRRKLNYATKEIDQEVKVKVKKRGKEVLSVLKKVGVFSRNYGPVQKTILEYMIPDESIVKSLAVPPPKKNKFANIC